MEAFLKENKAVSDWFPKFHVTLICDSVNLNDFAKEAYERLVEKGKLQRKTWEDLLAGTRQAHVDFLKVRDTMLQPSTDSGKPDSDSDD